MHTNILNNMYNVHSLDLISPCLYHVCHSAPYESTMKYYSSSIPLGPTSVWWDIKPFSIFPVDSIQQGGFSTTSSQEQTHHSLKGNFQPPYESVVRTQNIYRFIENQNHPLLCSLNTNPHSPRPNFVATITQTTLAN